MKLAADILTETMRSWGTLIEDALDQRLGENLACPDRLREAMRYSVFAGGKRLRPILTMLAAEACLGALDAVLPAACAVEMVHTYSLIHDDLPAMDDDDVRRGRPSCHRKFDEATAILAGDALLTLAFETLAELEPALVAVRCTRLLARAAGAAGMVGGQMDDLLAAHGPQSLSWLEALHQRKTGALIGVSLRMGAVTAGAPAAQQQAIAAYGDAIGLAFQIADDLLDVEGEAATVGKGVRKDADSGKLTYPGLLGVEASRAKARELAAAARAAVAPFGPAGERLCALADFIVERDR